jgi:hypothetical protein
MRSIQRRTLLAAMAIGGLYSVTPCAAADWPDYSNFDLAQHGIRPIQPQKKDAAGFVVGGSNATSLIKQLKAINGRTIAELEADMRPEAETEVGSDAGFLGKDERLLDVLAKDNALVVDELGLTHQAIGKHLHALGAIGDWLAQRQQKPEFRYQGRRYRVTVAHTRGYQLSPFKDGTKSGANATVINLDNHAQLTYGLLVPYMIERYGFYEGEGTAYRVDPRQAVKVLDFLQK